MLHTLYSISKAKDSSEIVLDQSHYTIFDSRNFKSKYNFEDTFDRIYTRFIKTWNTNIKPFIDAIMYDHSIYKVPVNKPLVLIPEEGIYLNLQGLDGSDVKYFYSTGNIRLIGITSDKVDSKNSLSIFDSPVFDPIHGVYYSAISIILYTKIFKTYKDNKDALNNILLRITNFIALNYMDNILSNEHNVPLNRILSNTSIDSNRDAIILPESLNISDTRFMFSYFYTLFRINISILNSSIINTFQDYSSIISLPDIFRFSMTDDEATKAEEVMKSMNQEEANIYALGFKHKIYNAIWNLASKNSVSDTDYISICANIMGNIEINLDRTFYESMNDYESYEDYVNDNQEEYVEVEEGE